MNERELRLRARIDVLRDERDAAIAKLEHAVTRATKGEALARTLAVRLNALNPDELRRRLSRANEGRRRIQASRDVWRDRARAAEQMLNSIHMGRRQRRLERRRERRAAA